MRSILLISLPVALFIFINLTSAENSQNNDIESSVMKEFSNFLYQINISIIAGSCFVFTTYESYQGNMETTTKESTNTTKESTKDKEIQTQN